jgi:4-aminobutyrate aminotransferase-like enzyme
VIIRAFERGLLVLGAGENVIRMMPPLMLGRDHADEALAILDAVLSEVESEL